MVSAASVLRVAARRAQQCRETVSAPSPSAFRAFSVSCPANRKAFTEEQEEANYLKSLPQEDQQRLNGMDENSESIEKVKAFGEKNIATKREKGEINDEMIMAKAEKTGRALNGEDVRDDLRELVHGMVPRDMAHRRTIEVPLEGRQKQGLFNMGEEPGWGSEDPEFEEDDITSIAHGQLEQHREYREYMRIAAWEMPLLSKLAKPFVPPTVNQPLRFRYTTYMGEDHPAEKKVVVEFCPADIPGLTTVQQLKLKKLAGIRYNPETEIIKMSSESFETQAQNKRYLGDLVDSLVKEAKDPKDTFEDVPLDTRHHTFKTKPKFPREWRITEERLKELKMGRELAAQADKMRADSGELVDGKHIISVANELSAVAALNAVTEIPVATKAKKVSIRR